MASVLQRNLYTALFCKRVPTRFRGTYMSSTNTDHRLASDPANASQAGPTPLDTLRAAEGMLNAELNELPLVSVVIPTYNRARVVERALKTAFDQTYRNMEIIVVDDGSTDDTEAALAPYKERIRYYYQKNGGASAARNRAIQESRGKYIAFLDSDDEWLPAKIEKQVALLEARPDLSFVACLSTNENRTYTGYDDYDKQFLKFIQQPFTQNMTRYVVRRECFEKHGLFDTSIHGPEDWELWLRLLKQGCRFGFVPDVLMIYTESEDAISSRPYAMLAGEKIIRERYVETLPGVWQRWRLSCRFRARSYMNAAVSFREQGQNWKSLGYMLSSILISPMGPRNNLRLRVLAGTICTPVLKRLRRKRNAR